MKSRRLCLICIVLSLGFASLWGQSSSAPVVENLSADPSDGDEGDVFKLSAAASHPDGLILTYKWDFGDGTPVRSGSSLDSVNHRYRDDGTFPVELTVSDSEGRSETKRLSVTVNNVAPEVRHVLRVGGSNEGEPISFNSLVLDPGNDELTYRWNFGDGQTQEGTDKRNTEHTYSEPGTYQLNLVVEDGDGGIGQYSQSVIIGTGFEYTISGAFGGGNQKGQSPFLTGVPVTPDGEFGPRLDAAKLLQGENPAKGSGFCFIGFGNQFGGGLSGDSVVTFRGAFPRGIEVGSYGVGAIRSNQNEIVEYPQSHLSKPGLFFGGVGISTGTPDNPSTADFESKGGRVQISYYDGDRIEATFSMNLLEVVRIIDPKDERYYPPRTILVNGSFAHSVNRDFLNGEFPDWYLCDPAENLVVESYSWSSPDSPAGKPFEADGLVDYENPEIEIQLSDQYNLDSFFEGFKVEYRRSDGEYEEVPGFMMGVDDTTVKFIPLEDLKDGVIYRARIENGSEGIKGLRGETLEDPVEWEFETLLNLEESLSGVALRTYQVIQDAPLVPGKPTLTRVFVNWSEKPEVHPNSQTKRALVEVSIKDGSGSLPYSQAKTVQVKRPDLYSDEEKKNALSSVNFFGWEPKGGESGPLIATVKQLPQPSSNPKEFEGQADFTFYEASPELVVDYFFVRVASWEEGVPTDLRVLGHRLARQGAEFTTQTFPVTQTIARSRGDLFIEEALISVPGAVSVYSPTTIEVGIDWEIGRRIADAASATGSDADLVLAFLPRELQPSLAGYAYETASRRTVAVFLHPSGESKSGNVNTVAHEFGHTFGLEHKSNCAKGEIDSCILQGLSDPIEGFRIDLSGSFGWNKSRAEGNQQASRTPGSVISLMYPSALGEKGTFILPEHYKHLQDELRSHQRQALLEFEEISPLLFASRASLWSQHPELQLYLSPAPVTGGKVQGGSPLFDGSQWMVQGVVRRNGSEGLITQIAPTVTTSLPPHSEGPFELVSMDEMGQRLSSRTFDLPEMERYHPAPGSGEIASFSVVVPSDSAAQKILLSYQGRTLHEFLRSPSKPAASFVSHDQEIRVVGATELSWEGSDADQDPLVYSLYYSPDGSSWSPIILATRQQSFTLEPAQLEPGRAPRLKLVVSDGFHWTDVDVPMVLTEELRVLYTLPMEGGTLDPGDSVLVTFSAPIDFENLPDESVSLLDSGGDQVELERFLSDDGHSVSLKPRTQLQGGQNYRLQIQDVTGSIQGRLSGVHTSSFNVAAAEHGNSEQTVNEEASDSEFSEQSIPDSCGGIEGTTLQLLVPSSLDSLSVVAQARGCQLSLVSADSMTEMRNFYESEILFNGFRMTENVTDSDGRGFRIGFSNAVLTGQVRVTEGAGNSREVKLQLIPQ